MMTRVTEKESDRRGISSREQECAAMLEAALARPGIREVMQVYDGWREKDRGLDAYRAATRAAGRIATTDTSNPCRTEWPGNADTDRKRR